MEICLIRPRVLPKDNNLFIQQVSTVQQASFKYYEWLFPELRIIHLGTYITGGETLQILNKISIQNQLR